MRCTLISRHATSAAKATKAAHRVALLRVIVMSQAVCIFISTIGLKLGQFLGQPSGNHWTAIW